ncbi:hypothetical protein LUZ63_020482 [Rhynchospora breviuscula]|uniref:Amidase domain-containing protein n=1 Tax=Rhynchospora breviuscula TaxID=2022672 RepID=A0A9P9Z8A0_9POAL|nr:hypothetical protein LUZ63_020482 [Rhynchospora breviuscula]
MARLLIVHHSPTPTVRSLSEAVVAGANDDALEGVEVVVRPALEASADDVLGADGYLLGTTANFGYMSGALKHFFDTIFLEAGGALSEDGSAADSAGAPKPYGLWVHGRYDTEGAVRSVTSIVQALSWRQSADVLSVLGDHDAVALAALVRRGEVTPTELAAAAEARLDAVDPHLNAVVRRVEHDPESAADGPFRGVPFLLKDLGQDLAGLPTSGGSRALAGVPATETATVVQRWLDAGLVVIGKTNTPELGAKGVTEPALFGPTRNPWDLAHSPGGSSGGSAAAVAAGVVPCAAASDGGGSIRIPASACGLVGLKPSRGLVPSGPAAGEPISGTTTNGVVSRTVRDSAAMLDVIAGPAPESPYAAARPGTTYAELAQREPGRLRVALCTATSLNPSPHPEAVRAATRTAELLEGLGHEVVVLERAPYDDAALSRDFLTSWFAHVAAQVEEIKAATGCGDDGFEPDTLVMAALGRATRATDYIRAVENRHQHVRRLADMHREHDLLLTPTTATPPPRIGALDPPAPVRLAQRALVRAGLAGALRVTPIVEEVVGRTLAWVPYTQLANLTGRPAISLPLHQTPEGLPIGSQLVAPLGGEGLLLQVATSLEQASPWAERRPVLPPDRAKR